MNLHPTCRIISLHRATKWIAFMEMTFGLFGIVWFVYMLGRYSIISLDPFEQPQGGNGSKLNQLEQWGAVSSPKMTERALSANHKAISLTLSGLFTIVNLCVFVILLIGAHRKSIALCLTWFYIRCAIAVFKVIIFFMYLLAGRPLFSQIPFIFFLIMHIYGLWVVNSYVEELRAAKEEVKQNEQIARRQEQIKEDSERDGIAKLQHSRELEFAMHYNDGFVESEKS